MSKSITQAPQNDKQISKSIKRFFTRFHVSSALKASNAYKKKGIPVVDIFQYLFLLIFSNRSMYMNLITGRNTPNFAKDTVYRFMKMLQINWIRFTTLLSSRIIKDAIVPLDSPDRTHVLIIDDSMFERNRSKKVELLAKAYDHANHRYRFGFRMLTLGWSDGSTFLPVNSVLLSSENKKNRVNEAAGVDKRTVGYKRRKLAMEKGTHAMLELLNAAKKAAIPAKYVLFDSWFSSPSTLHAVKSIGYDVIGMVKKTPKMFFQYKDENMSLITIYNKNKKRRGRSRYLLCVMVDVVKDGAVIPAKVVYVRNRNRRKEYLCLISTDVKETYFEKTDKTEVDSLVESVVKAGCRRQKIRDMPGGSIKDTCKLLCQYKSKTLDIAILLLKAISESLHIINLYNSPKDKAIRDLRPKLVHKILQTYL